MPAALKVVGDTFDGLVKLALDGASCGRKVYWDWLLPRWVVGMSVARNEPIHTSQEALNALNAGLLPIEIAVGRSREEAVHAGGIGAEAGDHVVGRDNVSEAL